MGHPRRVKSREVVEGRHLSELVPAGLPPATRRKRIAIAYDSIDEDPVAFRTAVVSSLLDPCSNPLPLFKLLVVVDKTERDREEPKQATVLSFRRRTTSPRAFRSVRDRSYKGSGCAPVVKPSFIVRLVLAVRFACIGACLNDCALPAIPHIYFAVNLRFATDNNHHIWLLIVG
jgi:hypothetical protein